jgi:dCMP deaminase
MDNQLKWDYRFLEHASQVALWSKDPSTKVGAVIVDDKRRIVAEGYNGFPRGVSDTPERLGDRPTKLAFTVHAEVNAILNANSKVEGCTLYVYPSFVLPFCCNECAKVVVQSGIRRVVGYVPPAENYVRFKSWLDSLKFSEQMFQEAGVTVDQIPYMEANDV